MPTDSRAKRIPCEIVSEVKLYGQEWVYLVSPRVIIGTVPPDGAVGSTRIEQVSSLVRVRDVDDFVYTIGDVLRHGESGDVQLTMNGTYPGCYKGSLYTVHMQSGPFLDQFKRRTEQRPRQ
jgi:hypothetical protein